MKLMKPHQNGPKSNQKNKRGQNSNNNNNYSWSPSSLPVRMPNLTPSQLLKLVNLDHSYALPSAPLEKKTHCFPARLLFQNEEEIALLNEPKSKLENLLTRKSSKRAQKAKVVEEEDIDVCTSDEDPKIPYDHLKARQLMKECEKNVNFARIHEVPENWEDEINKADWTKQQRRLFKKLMKILHEEHLRRLAYSENPSEPIYRRLSVDSTAQSVRTLLTEFAWETKLVQWLHGLLMDHLSLEYLAYYLDILQTLKSKVPNLVEKMITVSASGGKCNRATNVEALNLLLKRPWDPFATAIHTSKLKKPTVPAVFVVVPPGPGSGNVICQQRQRSWLALLAGLGKVVTVSLPPSAGQLTVDLYAEQMVTCSKTKLAEVVEGNLDRPIWLVGWGSGAIVAATLSLTEAVTGVICLAFPLHGTFGTRADVDDRLNDLKVPTLFVIGDRSKNSSITDMEIFRKGLTCINALSVICQADSFLRVTNYHQKRLLVTQSYVDKCIIDEIAWFLINVPILEEELKVQAQQAQEQVMVLDCPKMIPSNTSSSKRKAYYRPTNNKDINSPNYITASKLLQQTGPNKKKLGSNSTPGIIKPPPIISSAKPTSTLPLTSIQTSGPLPGSRSQDSTVGASQGTASGLNPKPKAVKISSVEARLQAMSNMGMSMDSPLPPKIPKISNSKDPFTISVATTSAALQSSIPPPSKPTPVPMNKSWLSVTPVPSSLPAPIVSSTTSSSVSTVPSSTAPPPPPYSSNLPITPILPMQQNQKEDSQILRRIITSPSTSVASSLQPPTTISRINPPIVGLPKDTTATLSPHPIQLFNHPEPQKRFTAPNNSNAPAEPLKRFPNPNSEPLKRFQNPNQEPLKRFSTPEGKGFSGELPPRPLPPPPPYRSDMRPPGGVSNHPQQTQQIRVFNPTTSMGMRQQQQFQYRANSPTEPFPMTSMRTALMSFPPQSTGQHPQIIRLAMSMPSTGLPPGTMYTTSSGFNVTVPPTPRERPAPTRCTDETLSMEASEEHLNQRKGHLINPELFFQLKSTLSVGSKEKRPQAAGPGPKPIVRVVSDPRGTLGSLTRPPVSYNPTGPGVGTSVISSAGTPLSYTPKYTVFASKDKRVIKNEAVSLPPPTLQSSIGNSLLIQQQQQQQLQQMQQQFQQKQQLALQQQLQFQQQFALQQQYQFQTLTRPAAPIPRKLEQTVSKPPKASPTPVPTVQEPPKLESIPGRSEAKPEAQTVPEPSKQCLVSVSLASFQKSPTAPGTVTNVQLSPSSAAAAIDKQIKKGFEPFTPQPPVIVKACPQESKIESKAEPAERAESEVEDSGRKSIGIGSSREIQEKTKDSGSKNKADLKLNPGDESSVIDEASKVTIIEITPNIPPNEFSLNGGGTEETTSISTATTVTTTSTEVTPQPESVKEESINKKEDCKGGTSQDVGESQELKSVEGFSKAMDLETSEPLLEDPSLNSSSNSSATTLDTSSGSSTSPLKIPEKGREPPPEDPPRETNFPETPSKSSVKSLGPSSGSPSKTPAPTPESSSLDKPVSTLESLKPEEVDAEPAAKDPGPVLEEIRSESAGSVTEVASSPKPPMKTYEAKRKSEPLKKLETRRGRSEMKEETHRVPKTSPKTPSNIPDRICSESPKGKDSPKSATKDSKDSKQSKALGSGTTEDAEKVGAESEEEVLKKIRTESPKTTGSKEKEDQEEEIPMRRTRAQSLDDKRKGLAESALESDSRGTDTSETGSVKKVLKRKRGRPSKRSQEKNKNNSSAETIDLSSDDEPAARVTRSRSRYSSTPVPFPGEAPKSPSALGNDEELTTEEEDEPVSEMRSDEETRSNPEDSEGQRKKQLKPIHPVTPASLSATRTRKITIPKFYAFGM